MDIENKQSLRDEIKEKTKEFLKTKKITVLPSQKESMADSIRFKPDATTRQQICPRNPVEEDNLKNYTTK